MTFLAICRRPGILTVLTLCFLSLGHRVGLANSSEVLCNLTNKISSSVAIRDAPGGKEINRLQNDRAVRVDSTEADGTGRQWASISSSYKGEWRNWGWVYTQDLHCISSGQLKRETLSLRRMKRLGIVSQSAFDTGQLPVSCDIVPNGWGVSISQALWKQYKKRGFTMTSMCLALGSDGVNFDPETGKRLPLYEFNGSDAGLRPLWVSDCFKTIDITGRGGYLVSWRPTGCKMQFHPMTGLRVSNPAAVELSAGGEAGGGVDETNENNTASEEKLKKLIYGQ